MIETSQDYFAQTNLAMLLCYGAFSADVDLNCAEALLQRSARLGWEHLACVFHGHMLMHTTARPTTGTVQRAMDLFYKAAKFDGDLGCA